ncbi:MAG: response regulator [Proteobacteria bacterium]|nr:response regulator [Pseudomonadota bacterium]MBU1058210.1 response regulator [Pseudomonadota bacterium]
MVGEQRFVLLMDDDEQICTIGALFLKNFGYGVECTSDGEHALVAYSRALAKGVPFCMAFLDLNIPGGMGGKETMGKLLEIDPSARGVVTSGDSTDPVFVEYRAHGFSGALSKPFNLADFQQVLESVSA